MSSLINKVKDKVEATIEKNTNKKGTTTDQYGTNHGEGSYSSTGNYGSESNNPSHNNPHSTNAGPHSSNLMNKADPKIDSDFDGRNDPASRVGGYGNTQHHNDNYGQTGGVSGYGSSDTYGSNANNPGYNNSQSTNAGPHSSNLMNKLDPRHDSDGDHRNDPTSRVGGYGSNQSHTENYGQTGHGGMGTTNTGYDQTPNTSSAGHSGYDNTLNEGPHKSNLANKLDPRVPTSTSSGYDNTPTHHETTSHTSHAGNTGHAGGFGSTNTYGSNTNNPSYNNPQSMNAGPHNSNLMNKLDPRTDSDRDHRNDPQSGIGGYGTQSDNYGHTSGVQGGTMSGTAGGYGDNREQHGGNSYTPGSGNTSNTAGPHNSDMMNKLDPRVDADMDGSKTYGGNRTFY